MKSKKIIISTIYAFLILSLFNCKFENKSINGEKENTEAQSFLKEFYGKIKTGNYSELKNYFSNSFYMQTSFNNWINQMNILDSIGGDFEGVKLIDYNSVKDIGTSENETYSYDFQVLRTNIITKEHFELIMENDSLKIHSYEIEQIK